MSSEDIVAAMGWNDESVRAMEETYIGQQRGGWARFERWLERRARAECKEAGCEFPA